METSERPPHRRSRSKSPSFSSSLLDAVLRSIDDNAYNSRIPFPHENQLQPLSQGRRDWVEEPPVNDRPVSRSCVVVTDYRHHSCPRKGTFAPNSRSSSSSTTAAATSTAGFSSSSDAESIWGSRIPRPGSPAMENKNKKSKCSYIRSGLRSLRRGWTTSAAATVTPPASPGARLARFLNSLLAAAKSSKKSMINIPIGGAARSTATGGSGGEGELTRCSSASSCRRSCMRKAHRQRRAGAEERKRSVRFYPVSVIVDEESRPCGHRRLHDHTVEPAAVRPVATRVEELLRTAGEEEKDEEQDCMSEASSDLFELENLTALKEREGGRIGGGGGGGGGCRDELPLYGTTDLNANYAIADDSTTWKNNIPINFSSAWLRS